MTGLNLFQKQSNCHCLEPNMKDVILPIFLWVIGIILLGEALNLFREYDYDRGYKTAVKEMEEYQTNAIAARLAREENKENEK